MGDQAARTKHHLKEGLMEEIHDGGWSRVTVNKIAERAQYHRTTFYKYYHSRDEIAQDLRREMKEEIKRTSMNRYSPGFPVELADMHEASFELLYFIQENRRYFDLLIRQDSLPGAEKDLVEGIYEVLREAFLLAPKSGIDVNTPVHKRYMAYGTAGLIQDWIQAGYQPGPEEVTKQLITVLHAFSKGFVIEEKR
ncbi:TetR/AcrR family transcriptional regulator [Alkalicoccus urumqiensis]|uniref:HTH tetR-type domain-containing protein n=1 Tax=Alkalicoccus urumqiensis TaxID=1548213 RepID=A0A2P6MGC9_ALKUR|nr:TetR/AcrR family transcriptional regulator [Alkalicoccus urumqiensis]PRO65352.1 hypothetical protein C6I21_09315 [Alkalicoccus urumqiensis]